MFYRASADMVVGVHFLFVLFAVFGGFFALRRPRIAWFHVPAFLWAGCIALFGWTCPLTYLENDLRLRGAAQGHASSFTENYILPILYPERLFPGGFPEHGFIWIGIFILALNGLIYGRMRRREGATRPPPNETRG